MKSIIVLNDGTTRECDLPEDITLVYLVAQSEEIPTDAVLWKDPLSDEVGVIAFLPPNPLVEYTKQPSLSGPHLAVFMHADWEPSDLFTLIKYLREQLEAWSLEDE